MSSNGPTKASHNMDHIKRPGVNYWDIIKAKAVQEDKRKRLSSTVSVLLLEDPRPSLNDWWIGSNPQDLDMEKFLKKLHYPYRKYFFFYFFFPEMEDLDFTGVMELVRNK